MADRVKIALVGPSAVGKDTLANYLVSSHGFSHISTGSLLREYIRVHNLGEFTREILRKTAIEVRQNLGSDYFVKQALRTDSKKLVVSGLRTVSEVESFKKVGGIVVGITAPINIRYEWAKKRGEIADGLSFENFRKMEELEDSSDNNDVPNVLGVMNLKDYLIVNDGSLADLRRKMDDIVRLC